MSNFSITDFNRLINSQVDAHDELTQQLILLRHIIDFTAYIAREELNAEQLNAQLTVIKKLLKETEAINERLQAALVQHRSQVTLESE